MFMKRLFLLTMMVLLIINIGASAFAADTESNQESKKQIRYENTAYAYADLSISKGKAIAETYVQGRTNTTKITMKMFLQKRSGSKWATVKTWRATRNTKSALLTGNQKVDRGTYRVRLEATVYCKGKKPESVKKNSNSVTYK